jgi:hypothetical protein
VIILIATFLGWALLVLALRGFVDNNAIRNCARELKRIADGLEGLKPESIAPELKRIADASEKSANIADRKWEP